jgi:hypothetical protein
VPGRTFLETSSLTKNKGKTVKFEVSERIHTHASKEEILRGLEDQFKKVSQRVQRSGEALTAKSIEASFGSINRSDTTTIRLRNTDDGYLVIADVHYRPSVAFWVLLVLMLFTYVFWLIPIIFYLIQKKTVRTGIQDVLTRVKNEFASAGGAQSQARKLQGQTDLDQLERLASLKDKGAITEEEFRAKKKQLLGL